MKTPYRLDGFLEAFDAWVHLEVPSTDLRIAVLAWVQSRSEKPYEGMRREVDFENLWFGTVPQTAHGSGQVVVCSYWIFERERLLRCDQFATLNAPI